MRYKAYYMKPGVFSTYIMGDKIPALINLRETHTFLREVEATSLDDVYRQSQGEIWSPNGEARPLIVEKGLAHTSMSIGDIIQDPDGGFHAVAFYGFTYIGKQPQP